MKLNIQLFAQTILDNEQSSTSSPTAYYTIEATPSNRITDKVDITIVVKSRLGSNQSSLGTGPSMGLEAYFTFNGNQNRSLVLKDTGESWTGTTEHTASVTYTITTNSPTQNSMTCSVHIYRTGSAAGSSSKGAQLWETNCSNITIPIVPASTITSVSSGTTNYAPSVVFTPKDATFKYKIKYSLNSWNYTTGFITPNTTSTYTYNSYTITTATLAPYLTNAASGTATATLYTYDSSGTQLGDPDSKTFTITLNSSVVPSVTIGTITEANATMQSLNWGVFVQNKSQLNIPITATGIYNSTITSVVTTINGKTFNGTNVTTTTLVTAGTNTISTTITDSRGRTATATKTYSVVAYANPTITTAQVQRCLSDGTISDDGTYFLFSFVGSISSVSNHNAKSFKLGYKKTTDANYTYVTLSTNYTINSINTISSFTISPDYSYDVVFEAEDSFTTTTITRQVDTGFDLMNFNPSGKAMAIGKVSEAGADEELFEIALPTEISNTLKINKYVKDELVVDKIRSKNIFDSNNFVGVSGSGTYIPTDTGIRATTTTTSQSQWGTYKLPLSLLGKTCTLSSIVSSSSSNVPMIRIYYGTSTNNVIQNAGFDLYGTGNKKTTNSFLSSLPSNCTGIYMLLYSNRDGTNFSTGSYCDYDNLQLETGENVTTYTPYQELDNKEIYTTGESIVGTWINGKPLYRKVISFSLTNGSVQNVAHNISNVEFIFVKDFFCWKQSSTFSRPLNYTYSTDTNYIQVNPTNFIYLITNKQDPTNAIGYAVLEYTKTTD